MAAPLTRPHNERRSPANAGEHPSRRQGATEAGAVPQKVRAPAGAERTLEVGISAFGGCNGELDSVENRR